jgi:hypothetical protein
MTHQSSNLTRRAALGITASAFVMPTFAAVAQTPAILVHKDPNCGCCSGWARHLKDAGFAVTVEEPTDLQPVKGRLGFRPISRLATLPRSMGRCWRDPSRRRRRCGGCWKNGRPPSDWRFPACPPDHREWREAPLSGMTLFSSERLATNPSCTLSARKTSVEAQRPQFNRMYFRRFRARLRCLATM